MKDCGVLVVSRYTKWYNKKREEMIDKFGGKCQVEGEHQGELEFAHLKETGLDGMGRGSYRRICDVMDNPKSYALLCRRHHLIFDSERGNKIYGDKLSQREDLFDLRSDEDRKKVEESVKEQENWITEEW